MWGYMKRDWLIGLAAVVIVAVAALTAWEWRGRMVGPPPPQPSADTPRAEAPSPTATPPSFDVVRVNPQGEAVIAGRGAPGAEVTILDGDRELGRVTVDRNGEWVLMPKEPLPPGSHQLSLSQRTPGGGAVSKSEGVVAMLVPERAQPNGGEKSSGPVAVLLPRNPGDSPRALQLPSDDAARKFALDIIEYDAAGKVQMLGRAAPDNRVQVYLNDRLAGKGIADSTGSWSTTLDGTVPLGRYRLRLEALDAQGKPTGRLALTFERVAPPPGFTAVDIQPGNTLWQIAQRSYGEGLRYVEIYRANQAKISDPNLIYPGQVFTVPSGR